MKRTFLEATGALAQVEARAAERSAASSDDTSDIQLPEDAEVGGVAEGASDQPDGSGRPDTVEASDAGLADVDSLFARIRAGQAEAVVEPEPAEAPAGPAPEAADAADAAVETSAPAEEEPAPEPEPEAAAEPEVVVALDAIGAWRARRAEVIDPLLASVAKRAKRTAQDDQNALLDAVRRHKGRPNAAQVLTPETDLLAVWVGVVREAIDEAYGAGRVAAGGDAAAAAEELTSEAVASIVLPLRERLASAIDAGEETDPGGLVERVRRAFSRVEEPVARERPRRRACDVVVAWRVRRRARGCGAPMDPAGRGSVRRLRRQRPRADGKGCVVSHRPGASTGAPRLSVPPGSRRGSQHARRERVNTVGAHPASPV